MKSMKFTESRPLSDPDAAASKLIEIANGVEAVQDGRIHIEKINGPFLFQLNGTPDEYKAGLDRAIANSWLWLHESGTYVKFTDKGTALFARAGPPMGQAAAIHDAVLKHNFLKRSHFTDPTK